MQQQYKITGTPNELRKLLVSEFSIEEKCADFFVAILLMEQQNNSTLYTDTAEDTALWYLHRATEPFQSPIFKTRYSISFTELKKSLAEQFFLQFGAILDGGDKLTASAVLSCLLAIYRSSTRIKDHECCVYYQALRWKATHPTQEYFSVDELMPNSNEGVCLYLDRIRDGKWSCDWCRQECCTVSKDNFCRVLEELEDRKVFVKFNDMYRFEK